MKRIPTSKPVGLPRFTYALTVCVVLVGTTGGGPGGSSSAPTHPKSAFIYATVLEGAIRSSVNDEPVVTYRTGQSFSEMPGDRHSVSENARKTEPPKLLAVFVVDSDAKKLTTPYKK